MIVSGGQERDSAIHIAVFILSQTSLPSRLPHKHWSEFPVLHSRSLLITYFKYIPILPKLPNYPFLFFKFQEWNFPATPRVWISTVAYHTKLFSQVVTCINIPISSIWEFFLPHALTKICCCQKFFFSDGKVISWFHFLDDEWDWSLSAIVFFPLWNV